MQIFEEIVMPKYTVNNSYRQDEREDQLSMVEDCIEWGSHFDWFDDTLMEKFKTWLNQGSALTQGQMNALQKTHDMLRQQVYS